MSATYALMQSYFSASEGEEVPQEEVLIPHDTQQQSIKQPDPTVTSESGDKSPSTSSQPPQQPQNDTRKRKAKKHKKKKDSLSSADFLRLANILLF